MEMTYEVGLNIGIELMREDIVKPKRFYICWIIVLLLLIDIYFLCIEPWSDY